MDNFWEEAGSAFLLLGVAAMAHHFHVFFLSIPMGVFAVIYLANVLRKELGL